MPDWSDGYLTDIPYTSQVYRELAPRYLSFACLTQGMRPPDVGPGSSYLELGCGQGYGTNLFAAANPGMRFVGVDFMPGHIASATRMAKAAGLANVEFLDLSFEQLLRQLPDAAPRFDFVVLHGIYSWVSQRNRETIVRLIDRCLKPGGLAYVSYNVLPGYAALAPIQRFMWEFASRNPGTATDQAAKALDAASDLVAGGAQFFKHNPRAERRLEVIRGQDPQYLAHEFLQGQWTPFYHADVVADMQGAKLDYVGSATLPDNIVEMSAPRDLVRSIGEIGDRVWKETLMDYAGSKIFRRDLFLRGAERLTPLELDGALADLRFVVTVPPEAARLKFKTPLGELSGAEAVYRPILEACAEAPRSLADLGALGGKKPLPRRALMEVLTLLVGSYQIAPVATGTPEREPAKRFNRLVADRSQMGDPLRFVASPLTGSALSASTTDLLALAVCQDGAKDAKTATTRAWNAMERTGARFVIDGAAIEDGGEARRRLAGELEGFFGGRLKTYRNLAVL